MATGVQESDVWEAADALLLAGEQPTIERVRLHLGRGSPNTVGPHLKGWFQQLGKRLFKEGVASSEIPDGIIDAAQHFWTLALKTAKAEWDTIVAHEREAIAHTQQQLAVEKEVLQSEALRLAQRETDLLATIHSAQEEAAKAHDRARVLDEKLSKTEERAQALEASLHEAIEKERALQQRNDEALAAAEQRHSAHERRWLTDIDIQRQQVKKLQEELEQQRKTHAHAEAQHHHELEKVENARKAVDISLLEANQALKTALRQVTELEKAKQATDQHLLAERVNTETLRKEWQARMAELTQRVTEQAAQLHIKDQHIASQQQALMQWQSQVISTLQAQAQKSGPDKRKEGTQGQATSDEH